MVSRLPEDESAQIAELVDQLITNQRAASVSEAERLRQYFAAHVLPDRPTARVLEKHAQHVQDDTQWPEDTAPDPYLQSLRDTLDADVSTQLVDVARSLVTFAPSLERMYPRQPSNDDLRRLGILSAA